jgi:hypothetical protein
MKNEKGGIPINLENPESRSQKSECKNGKILIDSDFWILTSDY